MTDTEVENDPSILRLEIDGLKRQLELTDEIAAIHGKMLDQLTLIINDHEVRVRRPWWRMPWW